MPPKRKQALATRSSRPSSLRSSTASLASSPATASTTPTSQSTTTSSPSSTSATDFSLSRPRPITTSTKEPLSDDRDYTSEATDIPLKYRIPFTPKFQEPASSNATLRLKLSSEKTAALRGSGSALNVGKSSGQTLEVVPTFWTLDAEASMWMRKSFCPITGMRTSYRDPQTGLRFYNSEVYRFIKSQDSSYLQQVRKMTGLPSESQ